MTSSAAETALKNFFYNARDRGGGKEERLEAKRRLSSGAPQKKRGRKASSINRQHTAAVSLRVSSESEDELHSAKRCRVSRLVLSDEDSSS